MATPTPSPPAASGPDALIQQGIEASRSGDGDAALALWQQASNEAPDSGVPHFLMASEFAAMGEMDRAEAAFANAVLLAPGLLVARYQLGLLQFSSGRAAMALVTWEPLLGQQSNDPIAPALGHFVRGYAALAGDDFEGALRHYGEGLAVNTVNEAMSQDVRLVVQRIQALLGSRGEGAGPDQADTAPAQAHRAGDPAEAADAAEAAPDDSAATHVLLSNYQSHGKPH